MTDFDLSRYIYWEYSLAVVLFTEVIRALTRGIDNKIVRFAVVDNPKWLSLTVTGTKNASSSEYYLKHDVIVVP